jgi:hypothetical protein
MTHGRDRPRLREISFDPHFAIMMPRESYETVRRQFLMSSLHKGTRTKAHLDETKASSHLSLVAAYSSNHDKLVLIFSCRTHRAKMSIIEIRGPQNFSKRCNCFNSASSIQYYLLSEQTATRSHSCPREVHKQATPS